jgi:hypothetical protein
MKQKITFEMKMFEKCKPDGVVGAQTDPLGDRAVLTLLLAKDALGAERFVGRLKNKRGKQQISCRFTKSGANMA